MTFNAENLLLIGSVLIFISIIVTKRTYHFGIPSLLIFLIVGMLFGSDGLGLQFNNASQAQFIGMMALSVILFTGGMDTRIVEIKPVLWQGLVLSTMGVLLTTFITGLFIYLISGWSAISISMSLLTSMLLAATMSSTDSASVFNLLRSQKMMLKNNLRPMLELESGSNDPMAYMLTIVLIQIISAGEANAGNIVKEFALQFAIGGIAGYAMGKFMVWMLNKIKLTNSSLHAIMLLAIVFITFTVTDLTGGNGYLAVYISGVITGNAKMPFRRETATFMDGLTWLFQIIMFLSLGLLVNPHELLDIALPALLIGIFMILVARPASVFLSLVPFRKMAVKSKLFVSWVGLRGAVPIIFATYPVVSGIEGANQIFNIVFFITLLSLIVQGSSISWMARMLHLDSPMPKEGNDFGIELPDEITSELHEVILGEEHLRAGNRLADMNIPRGSLVILVKRNDQYIVPDGKMELMAGDRLLVMTELDNAPLNLADTAEGKN